MVESVISNNGKILNKTVFYLGVKISEGKYIDGQLNKTMWGKSGNIISEEIYYESGNIKSKKRLTKC